MHYLMLVTLTLGPDATSSDARRAVYDTLANDPSFCSEGGRFSYPICDWFVIGGRWSGHFKEKLIGEAYQTALAESCPELAAVFYTEATVNKHRARLNQLWHEFGGSGDSPYLRSLYEDLGYEDDAVRVDASVYSALLQEYAGCSHRDDGGHSQFADLDGEVVDESFIGNKWLVVVDYHN